MDAHLLPPFCLLIGWVLDLLLGDPPAWPHPVVLFGRVIAAGERWLNRGRHRVAKGALLAVGCTLLTFILCFLLIRLLRPWPWAVCLVSIVLIFFCLAGTTLRREVRLTLEAVDRSVEEGRQQVARIVGRDTATLSAQEVRQAALETLAENLSDGVVAPLFWLLLLGVPGMLAYKMVNTLDSMIAYRTSRYLRFGRWAARMDDVANFLPARLTAMLMVILSRVVYNKRGVGAFVLRYARRHTSPNSGWPEAALAGTLDCQLGGSHTYFGELSQKPYIGHNPRPLTTSDGRLALHLCLWTEVAAVVLSLLAIAFV